MQLLFPDARLAELVYLDVLDLRLDGTYVINGEFLRAAREADRADPSRFDTVFGDLILARAMQRGHAVVEVDELALLALEIASA